MDIESIRGKIDRLDKKLLKLLVERFFLTKKIGRIKRNRGLAIEDLVREEEILSTRASEGEGLKVDSHFVRRLFKLILVQSKTLQKKD